MDGNTKIFIANTDGEGKSLAPMLEAGTYTIYSSVAKDPNNLSNPYSKTVTVDESTQTINMMPEGNILYWWGYEGSELEDMSTANGWVTDVGAFTFASPVRNANYIDFNATASNTVIGVGSKNSHDGNFMAIAKGVTISGNAYGGFQCSNFKSWYNLTSQEIISSTALAKYVLPNQTSKYFDITSNYSSGTRRSELYALWYE